MNLDLNSHVRGKLCPEVAPSPANDLVPRYFETSPIYTEKEKNKKFSPQSGVTIGQNITANYHNKINKQQNHTHGSTTNGFKITPRCTEAQRLTVTIGHLNINRLRFKMDNLQSILNTHKIHIMGITETWLDNTISDGEVQLPGYRLFRHDRQGKTGGGVCIYVHHSVTVRLLPLGHLCSKIEMLWIAVTLGKVDYNVGYLYRPPKAPAHFWSDLDNALEDLAIIGSEAMLLGDINVDHFTQP